MVRSSSISLSPSLIDKSSPYRHLSPLSGVFSFPRICAAVHFEGSLPGVRHVVHLEHCDPRLLIHRQASASSYKGEEAEVAPRHQVQGLWDSPETIAS